MVGLVGLGVCVELHGIQFAILTLSLKVASRPWESNICITGNGMKQKVPDTLEVPNFIHYICIDTT